MARHYILQDWQNAAEYSGQMIGDRLSKSSQLHFKKNGMANIDLYADEGPKKKSAKKKSAFEQADLANRHYERLEQISCDLDAELDRGEITASQWAMARKQLDKRLDRAWQRVADANGWDVREKDEEIYSLCLSEMQEKNKQKECKKGVDNYQEQSLSFSHELIDSLGDGNCFKKPLQKLFTAKEKMVKILEILKS